MFLAFSQKATFISPHNINRMVSNTDVCELVKAALSSKWCIPRKKMGYWGMLYVCQSIILRHLQNYLTDFKWKVNNCQRTGYSITCHEGTEGT